MKRFVVANGRCPAQFDSFDLAKRHVLANGGTLYHGHDVVLFDRGFVTVRVGTKPIMGFE